MSEHDLEPGSPWPEHYRGFTLHVNADGDIWWQQYGGEQRLFLEDPPDQLVDNLLRFKRAGAQFRVTEHNDVIAKQKDEEEGTYDPIYVGRLEDHQRLLPDGDPEYAVELSPDGLAVGDLWPSVYDGTRYSLTGPDRIWWHNPDTKRRHPVTDGIPESLANEITLHKRGGGSFRVTPWGDVITLIDTVPEPENVKAQFENLPRVVQNIIRLRNARGLEMLPIYVGNLSDTDIEVGDPRDLTSELGDNARQEIEQWIESLGPTGTAPDDVNQPESESGFDDDPAEWATVDIDNELNDE